LLKSGHAAASLLVGKLLASGLPLRGLGWRCSDISARRHREDIVGLKTVLSRAARGFNTGVVALLEVPVLGPLMGKGFVVITYVGRRSGRTFSTPVNYRRKGNELIIGVALPDKKSWWRNFLGEGGPITLHSNGADRRGHAVARRDEHGRVIVKVRLDEAS
jgi:hypothetical protein